MKLTRTQKKAELAKVADELIEQLLDWDEANRAPNLTQIEDEVLELRQRFGQGLAGVVAAGQEAGQPVESPVCASCGKEMRYKGQKGRDVESRLGELEAERGYYYCAACKSGLFPPGRAT